MSSPAELSNLFDASGLDGQAVAVLDLTADTLGPAIMDGLGSVSLDDITTSEVVLVTLLIDDSGSIRFAGNSGIVCQGHNEVLAALAGSKSAATILVSCRYLNGTVLYPYVPLDQAVQMDSRNFNPTGGTPLYDMTTVTLAGVAAKAAEFELGGVAVRTVTYVITDGEDTGSRHPAADVHTVIAAMLRTETHIIGAMGIKEKGAPVYNVVDFRAVFADMGIPDNWVLTPDDDPTSIRRAFGTISRSAVRASQAAGSFSMTALGGFGN